jgi:MGT family glycosyltransferase
MHPMFSLARELQRRGHRISALMLPDAREKCEAAGIDLVPIGVSEYPAGRIQADVERLGRMSGPKALDFTLELIRHEVAVQLRELPGLMRELKIDGILTDQVSFAGGSSSEAAGIPFVTICNALMLDQDAQIPPLTMHWSYRNSWWARLRNRFGYRVIRYLSRNISRDVNAFRTQHDLAPHRTTFDWPSRLATVAQVPAAFDFPRDRIPPTFHYAGPFVDPAARAPRPFPFERLDGRPVIYASMGTLQNRVSEQFRIIAAACAQLPVQAVLALGGAEPSSLGSLPGAPIVVRYAPQLELLRRAAVTVTHAGLNTVLESLSCGVPLIAIPITNDQPGVAARVEWLGAGERILPNRLTVDRLKVSLERVLSNPSYRASAARLQACIAESGGVRTAADVIEQAVSTRQPVLAPSVGTVP